MPMNTSNTFNMETAGSSAPLLHEILVKVNNAKDKSKKIEVLREHDSVPLRQVLKGAFDPNIEWLLPDGDVPYTANDAPVGTEHTLLQQEAKRLYLFTKGGDNSLSSTKRQTLFIQMLEGLHPEEAKIICLVKDKNLTEKYKLTKEIVAEAFPDIAWGLHRGT